VDVTSLGYASAFAVAALFAVGCTSSTSNVAVAPDGAAHDAGARTKWASEAIASPPSYTGTVDDGAACEKSYATTGFEPVDSPGAKHPLFLYFIGTIFTPGDQGATYDAQAPKKVAEAMARRGFVALSVQYDNSATAWLSDHTNQLACLFGPANASSLISAACALPNVDCNQGIAAWGHSQGALVADLMPNYDARVRAVWATGYGGDARATLPVSRLRVVNGEADSNNGTVATLDKVAGFTATECPDDGRKECLRSDGSGFIIVQKKDCALTSADHCWFDKVNCLANEETLEPNWIAATPTKSFALETNADWVAKTVRRLQ
jgi:hypothetical protein